MPNMDESLTGAPAGAGLKEPAARTPSAALLKAQMDTARAKWLKLAPPSWAPFINEAFDAREREIEKLARHPEWYA